MDGWMDGGWNPLTNQFSSSPAVHKHNNPIKTTAALFNAEKALTRAEAEKASMSQQLEAAEKKTGE